jgi:putative ABC transport system substrate-binding protein
VLWNSDTPYHARAIDDLKAVAPSLGLELTFYNVRLPSEFGTAVSAIRHAHAQAIYAIEDPFFYNHRSRLVKLTLAARLPAMFGTKAYAEVGGLMSYGVDYGEGFRRSAEYADKILKGAKPGELPIEQPTKFELFVNLRTASALGIAVPDSVLLRADQVIR